MSFSGASNVNKKRKGRYRPFLFDKIMTRLKLYRCGHTVNHIPRDFGVIEIQHFQIHFFYLIAVFLYSQKLTGLYIFKNLHGSAGGPFYNQFINNRCFPDSYFFSKW